MSENRRFNRLLEPGKIGQIKIKNRMVRTAAGTDFVAPGGMLKSRQEVPFYEALARGGIGLIIIGASSVDYPLTTASPVQLKLADDRQIPGFREVTEIAHKYQTPVFLQVFHPGAWRNSADGVQPVSASYIPIQELQKRGPEFIVAPRTLTVQEIKGIQNAFAETAERARKAGFDGIEINAATCHLANSFLSRAWNRRQDEYGCQNMENRSRFVRETLKAIKDRVGQDVPVGILMNGGEYGIEDGLTSEETQELARIFEQAGFDYISVRAFGYMSYFDLHIPDSIYYPEPPKRLGKPLDTSRHGAGITVPLATAIKQVVSIPVVTVGKINANLGEEILEKGKADFIGLARPLIADPEFPNKVASGNLDDIVPCTYCLSCFGYVVDRGEDTRCRINAAVGGEEDYDIKPASRKKKVMIIGAGPAGMEAARVVALRGHEVTLLDKERRPGGLLPLASMIRGMEVENLEAIIRYYDIKLQKLGVKVLLQTVVTPSNIGSFKPDVIIVASGGIPVLPDIPGIHRPNVLGMPDLHRRVKPYLRLFGPRVLRELTRFYLPIAKKVIVMGNGAQAAGLVEFLVKRGRRVTWVTTTLSLADRRMPQARTLRLFRWLDEKGVIQLAGVRYLDIDDKGLTLLTKEGQQQKIEADCLLPVAPLTPDLELFNTLQSKAPEVYHVGDSREPGLILDAIAGGYRVGLKI